MPEQKRKRVQVPLPEGNFGALERVWEQLRLAWLLFGDNRVSLALKVLPVLAIAYVISPLDMLPALLFRLLGVLDDVAIFGLAIMVFNSLSPEDAVVEHLRQLRFGGKYRIHSDEDGVVIDVKATPSQDGSEAEPEADAEPFAEPRQQYSKRDQ
ncbi:MAG: hypothetical protein CUN49_06135 [Candidatus Thermofonsia Clade 1 bacterium]|jgi:uncharacterized membrane protein YkvA (DUF1232 family)|uniref:DUF1232 domain-containing protein n=1 Tax=Candidatus Thermofonsia Clade 1 bacterium TaxID=2364210 RepID=A0A2M8PFI7_9CHLR|nr:MAG: hypothetical protein CUN49_06135 [Candidatus Thermofonsia Clade 1 bacterium]RMF50439.1 MAG: DUF1232 domain-containing protein [Chloroflexota bacterium]